MNWDDFDAFCQVVDHGGFTAAARALDRPKSSLSAAVTRLETRMGARLLERSTRSLRLTESGESLYRDISAPFTQLRERAGDAMARGSTVQGSLRIAAPYEFGAHHLAQVACAVMAAHPELRVQIDVEHARVALFERHYDIVFSATDHDLPPSSIVARRVFSLARGLFAAPQLVAHRPPLHPDDLAALPLLAGADDSEWEFSGPGGTPATLPLRSPRLRSANAGIRLQAALAGLGVTRITATYCAAAVQEGRLVPLLAAWACAPLRVYALLPGRRLMPAKVRLFLDGVEAHAQDQQQATDGI
ncbi:MAG: LysR family transcriptional regulator [Ramlibacter sp.]